MKNCEYFRKTNPQKIFPHNIMRMKDPNEADFEKVVTSEY